MKKIKAIFTLRSFQFLEQTGPKELLSVFSARTNPSKGPTPDSSLTANISVIIIMSLHTLCSSDSTTVTALPLKYMFVDLVPKACLAFPISTPFSSIPSPTGHDIYWLPCWMLHQSQGLTFISQFHAEDCKIFIVPLRAGGFTLPHGTAWNSRFLQ